MKMEAHVRVCLNFPPPPPLSDPLSLFLSSFIINTHFTHTPSNSSNFCYIFLSFPLVLLGSGGRLEAPHSEPSSDDDDDDDDDDDGEPTTDVEPQPPPAAPETVADKSTSSTPGKVPGK